MVVLRRIILRACVELVLTCPGVYMRACVHVHVCMHVIVPWDFTVSLYLCFPCSPFLTIFYL